MNPSQIYTEATTPQSVKDARESNQLKQQADKTFQSSFSEQAREEWLNHPYTIVFIAGLTNLYSSKVDEVVDRSDKTVIGSLEKVHKLIVVKTLKKVINYARTGKYNND